jgi:hypothetical protein
MGLLPPLCKPGVPHLSLESAIAASAAYLRSPAARASVERDPYWPKWDSPWWHVLALEEVGALGAVPQELARALLERVARFYVPFFPRDAAELPPGKSILRHVLCHCALGSLIRVSVALGLDVEAAVPWSRGWFVRYQLPDGGWNCDEKATGRPVPRSSFVSTLPPLEALLALGRVRRLEPDEVSALDRGAEYLLRHRLVCSARTGEVVRPEWLQPALPRFYEYDALRALRFLVAWSTAIDRFLPREPLQPALAALEQDLQQGRPPRRWHGEHQTLKENAAGEEAWAPSSSFDLIEALAEPATAAAILGEELRGVVSSWLRR